MLTLHVARHPGESHVALLRHGALAEFWIDRPGDPDGWGDLYWARITAPMPAMAGAFVSLGTMDAFLPDSEGAAGLTQGQHLPVQVTRAAQAGKGPRVTARVAPSAPALSGPARLLARGPGPLAELRALYPDAALVEGAFTEPLAAEIEALGQPAITLPGGLTGTIVPTPALVAIDLDSAGATHARLPKHAAQAEANRQALPEIARQIVLRNLAGAILIDLCGMPARRRAALRPPLEDAMRADRMAPRLLGFTSLGFAEILRPTRRPPLHQRLAGPHAAGLAALRAAARQAAQNPQARLTLHAAPAIVTALNGDQPALESLARLTTYRPVLRSDATLPALSWRLEHHDA